MERGAIEDAYRGPTWWTLGTLRGLLQAKRLGRNRVVHESASSQALVV